MRKLYALVLGLLTLQAFAQPTLTSAGLNPMVGETFSMAVITSGGSFDIGNAGSNQTYNFAALSGTGSTVSMVTPNSTGVSSQFAGSTVAASFGSYYSFYTPSNLSLELKGNYSSGVAYIYTNTKSLIAYPMTYNSSFVDTYTNYYTVSGLTTNSNGTASMIADGYGTLVLPWGTLTDVLRVKEEDSYTSTSNVSTANVTGTVYYYFKEGIHMPVVTVTTYSTNGFPGPTTVTMLTEMPSSISEPSANVNVEVYPNPTTEYFNVTNLSKGDSMQLFDAEGRLVWTAYAVEGINTCRPTDLASRIYYLVISTKQGMVQKKLVIQRP
jgi:hypothetical protein